MARLVIVVEVDQDPTLVDPYDVADSLVDTYEEERRANRSLPIITFVSAEWLD